MIFVMKTHNYFCCELFVIYDLHIIFNIKFIRFFLSIIVFALIKILEVNKSAIIVNQSGCPLLTRLIQSDNYKFGLRQNRCVKIQKDHSNHSLNHNKDKHFLYFLQSHIILYYITIISRI